MKDIGDLLKAATQILQQSGIAEPRQEAYSLLTFSLNKDKTFLIAHPEYVLAENEERIFRKSLSRRASREPFQHITGRQEFYRLNFEVSKDVLIPRPETEMIVENAVKILQKIENPIFCEVGTGSGCISVSILHELEKAAAVGLDISAKALEMTRRNAEIHHVAGRLQLRISSTFSALNTEIFDLIVSNPPYIPLQDFPRLQIEVKNFEPKSALTDGGNGLSIIAEIIAGSPKFLRSRGFLLMEIGFGQATEVRSMFSPDRWRTVDILPDLQEIPRMIKAQIN